MFMELREMKATLLITNLQIRKLKKRNRIAKTI